MTTDNLVTLDAAALATISGGEDQPCMAIDDAAAATMVANGACTAFVRTGPGTVIELPTRRLNEAFKNHDAAVRLAKPQQ
jgi:hypothetical protein